jgi:nicotinic acid mononucleotide adenylyltransferase
LNTKKFRKPDPSEPKRPAVLFFFGTFCPIHLGHLDVMKQGEAFAGKTHQVLGGFISPCHSSYLYSKLSQFSMPNGMRNHLIELAVEDDPVWTLDPYMSLTSEFLDNHEVLHNFSDRLTSALGSPDIDIFWLIGADGFELMTEELYRRNFHMVFI